MLKEKNRVLLIGWDAADWKVINPLLDSGRMPALESLVNRGVIGKLASLEPSFSPMLWTSIATGKTADKHGVLGFIEPSPDGNGIRPVNVTSRKVRAFWNILHHKGKHVNVINWWPSYPAEPVNGVIVSNYFPKPIDLNRTDKCSGSVHPPDWHDRLIGAKVFPDDITDRELLNFVPDAIQIDQEKDKSLLKLSMITAESLSVFRITRELLRKTDWDMTAVYFGGIDQYSHQFMKYHPPKLSTVSEGEFGMYRNVINAAYIFHDEMLARLLKEIDEHTTVILISDHGFHSDHLRPQRIPEFTAGAALEHSPYGIICMAGPGIVKDERIHGASLLDITPTILHIFDLPVGKDMDGKCLASAFKDAEPSERIESWEQVAGDFGEHPETTRSDPYAGMEAMQQLVELGYIEPPSDDIQKAIRKTREEMEYNLSRTYLGIRKYSEAIPLLSKLYHDNPSDIRFNLDLLRCHIEMKNFEGAGTLIDHIEQLKEGNRPSVDLLKSVLLIHEGQYREARELLERIRASYPHFPNLQTNLGNVYLKSGMYQEACEAYKTAIDTDEGNAGAYRGMAISCLRLKRYEEATEYAINAIGLFYNAPLAHFHLGEALYYLGKYREASHAFEVALKMAPQLYKARIRLRKIYMEKLDDINKATIHNQYLNRMMKGEITIVSGLPRSGTSMMMQMLHAGGIPVLTDKHRAADANNPNGYYEYQPVKSLKKDQSFLAGAEGRAVKIIVQLLRYLPPEYYYRIVFMQRDMNEIMVSQQKMLGKSTSDYSVSIVESYQRELEIADAWARKEPNVDILYVNYENVVCNPAEEAERVRNFLGNNLDISQMIQIVNKDLYRNRVSSIC
jgi:predicted AlkP superfamily phosphohydrolase/phosphomutase/tetratricopeptide (TPR) repeat protein